MTPPFRPSPSAPGGCGGDRCASGRDAWPLHHFLHEGVFCRLCSSCILLYRPAAFCSACLHLLSTSGAAASAPPGDPAVAPPGPTAPCSACGLSVAHLSCVQGDPASFVCPPCAAAAENMPFSFTPPPPPGVGGRRTLDERDARVLLVAARLAHDAVSRAAAAARVEAERRVAEAAMARKRSREMLDTAFRALEAEAREAKMRPAPPPPPLPQHPKKKTPKSTEVNRDKDRLLKLNAMQQPALAFAAAAAAAAADTSKPLPITPPSMPLPMPPPPPSREVKQEEQGSAPPVPREVRHPLFGTLHS
ncbi:hypothetical protein HU200_009228 [Digitaria exilis]|uniref:Uncharacterized protein n=1 Tax=Digitaria exilis TaxID=1010633 RepID=A0A835FKF7_9POAL|nr:hypothetical protein HU200_009228 [Digitaria exilis]CAB3460126.1 unnamed protein product [Digitaria exilis]